MLRYLVIFFLCFISFQVEITRCEKTEEVVNEIDLDHTEEEVDEVAVDIEEIDYTTLQYKDVPGTKYLFAIISQLFDAFIKIWNANVTSKETVQEVWFVIERIFKHSIGSVTVEKISNHFTETMTHPLASDTLGKLTETVKKIFMGGKGLDELKKLWDYISKNEDLQTVVKKLIDLFFHEKSIINSSPSMKLSYRTLKYWITKQIQDEVDNSLKVDQSIQIESDEKPEIKRSTSLKENPSLKRSQSLNNIPYRRSKSFSETEVPPNKISRSDSFDKSNDTNRPATLKSTPSKKENLSSSLSPSNKEETTLNSSAPKNDSTENTTAQPKKWRPLFSQSNLGQSIASSALNSNDEQKILKPPSQSSLLTNSPSKRFSPIMNSWSSFPQHSQTTQW